MQGEFASHRPRRSVTQHTRNMNASITNRAVFWLELVEAPGIEPLKTNISNAVMSLVFLSQVFDLPALPRRVAVCACRREST